MARVVKMNQSAQPSQIVLDPILRLTDAASLQEVALAAVDCGHGVLVDAGDVKEISTSCLQVVLALKLACETSDQPFNLVTTSQAFQAAVDDLGLTASLAEEGTLK